MRSTIKDAAWQIQAQMGVGSSQLAELSKRLGSGCGRDGDSEVGIRAGLSHRLQAGILDICRTIVILW